MRKKKIFKLNSVKNRKLVKNRNSDEFCFKSVKRLYISIKAMHHRSKKIWNLIENLTISI